MESAWRQNGRRENETKKLMTCPSFDHQKEVKINLKGQSWPVLPELWEAGQQFHEQRAREAEQRKEEEVQGRRRKREEGRQIEIQRQVVGLWWLKELNTFLGCPAAQISSPISPGQSLSFRLGYGQVFG